jgi:prepilin-type N-terminal cleavage/methylation domain-containing protein
MFYKKTKGFTLIELLVVVAIISLLSSIVMASLNSARNKAKDAAIKEAANQLATLMALNYNDYGSFCQIQPQVVWISASGYTCDTLLSSGLFLGTYAQKARDICNNMYNNAADYIAGSTGYRMLIYLYPNTCTTSFSWEIFLNNGNWFCIGSGGKSESTNYWSNPGCYGNP